MRDNRASCRARYHKLRQQGLCTVCGQLPPRFGFKCDACHERHRQKSLESHQKLKDRVFKHYGGYTCACCGLTKDSEFVHMDHKNGGGNEHRRQIGGHSGGKMYRWLERNGFPSGFQPLCADCNTAKGYFGECPHERRRREGKFEMGLSMGFLF